MAEFKNIRSSKKDIFKLFITAEGERPFRAVVKDLCNNTLYSASGQGDYTIDKNNLKLFNKEGSRDSFNIDKVTIYLR